MAHPDDFDLQDPKMVGASEYHAIYETLVDALDGCEEDVATSPREFALSVLDEFIGHAQSMRAQVASVHPPAVSPDYSSHQ